MRSLGPSARWSRRWPLRLRIATTERSPAEFLRAEGGNAELIEAIKKRRWRELLHLGPRDRALCAIAEKLSANAPRVTVTDWGGVARARL